MRSSPFIEVLTGHIKCIEQHLLLRWLSVRVRCAAIAVGKTCHLDVS